MHKHQYHTRTLHFTSDSAPLYCGVGYVTTPFTVPLRRRDITEVKISWCPSGSTRCTKFQLPTHTPTERTEGREPAPRPNSTTTHHGINSYEPRSIPNRSAGPHTPGSRNDSHSTARSPTRHLAVIPRAKPSSRHTETDPAARQQVSGGGHKLHIRQARQYLPAHPTRPAIPTGTQQNPKSTTANKTGISHRHSAKLRADHV